MTLFLFYTRTCQSNWTDRERNIIYFVSPGPLPNMPPKIPVPVDFLSPSSVLKNHVSFEFASLLGNVLLWFWFLIAASLTRALIYSLGLSVFFTLQSGIWTFMVLPACFKIIYIFKAVPLKIQEWLLIVCKPIRRCSEERAKSNQGRVFSL